MEKVYIIGIGPGTEEYLLPLAKKKIERVDCLIGAKRILGLFAKLDKEKIYLEGHFSNLIQYIKENRHKKKIAVLVSGDPGLYSFLGQFSETFKKEDYIVIPGISAVQIAFARIGESWQDAKIISLHGRKLDSLSEEIKNSNKVFLFTDSKFPPQRIAIYLLNEGIGNRRAIVFEQLSYPNEKIIDTDLKSLSKMGEFKLCVTIIKKEIQ